MKENDEKMGLAALGLAVAIIIAVVVWYFSLKRKRDEKLREKEDLETKEALVQISIAENEVIKKKAENRYKLIRHLIGVFTAILGFVLFFKFDIDIFKVVAGIVFSIVIYMYSVKDTFIDKKQILDDFKNRIKVWAYGKDICIEDTIAELNNQSSKIQESIGIVKQELLEIEKAF